MTVIANPKNIQAFDFSVDLLKTILWQYNNAENLQKIVAEKQAWYDANQTEFWGDWLVDVFDLRTANEFGLSVWSIILGLPLFVNTTPDDLTTKPTFGFDSSFFKNFDRGNFSTTTGDTNNLPLETKRLALQLRAFQLSASGTVPETNRFLAYIFGPLGKAFVVDNHDMTQTYVFTFQIDANLNYLLSNFDLLPRPAGVKNIYKRLDRADIFGFDSSFFANFNNGNFGA